MCLRQAPKPATRKQWTPPPFLISYSLAFFQRRFSKLSRRGMRVTITVWRLYPRSGGGARGVTRPSNTNRARRSRICCSDLRNKKMRLKGAKPYFLTTLSFARANRHWTRITFMSEKVIWKRFGARTSTFLCRRSKRQLLGSAFLLVVCWFMNVVLKTNVVRAILIACIFVEMIIL